MKRYISTWAKHFFFRFLGLVTLLIGLAFLLFVFVDLLSHIKDVADPKTEWSTWGAYYLCLLSYRLNALIPFSIAAATALLLPRIVRGNELIPLLNAGISLKRITLPFIAVACIATCFLWINTQFIHPKAMRTYNTISETDFGRKSVHQTPSRLGIIFFSGGGRLFFREHHAKEERLVDTFWVKSFDCVFHIEDLHYFEDRSPEGRFVDVIERNGAGKMLKTASYPFCELPELQLTRETIEFARADPRDLSLSQLATQLVRFGPSSSERANEVTISFLQKLLLPLLACLAFFIPAPLCLSFELRLPQTVLLFVSLASLFCLNIFFETAAVLARAAPTHAVGILLVPWLFVIFFVWRSFQRLSA